MSQENVAAWATDSGLATALEGTIENPFFDYDPEYRDGETPLLHLPLVNVTSDEDPEIKDTLTLTLGTGNGWEVVDNGEAVARSDGKSKGFHEKTRVGILVDRIVEIGAVETIAERGTPTQAKVWDGLRFKFENHEEDYGEIDGEQVKVNFLLPVELVGSETDGGSTNGKVDEKVVTRLKALARNSATHDEFLDQALDIDGVADNDSLFEQVSDAGDTGFYAANAA